MKKNIPILVIAMITAVCSAQESESTAEIIAAMDDHVSKMEAAQQSATIQNDAQTRNSGAETAGIESGGRADPALQALSLPEQSSPVSNSSRDQQAEKERRNAENEAMDAVTAAWNSMILRDYELSPATVEKMKLNRFKQSTDVRALFPDVDFPEGSKAIYRPVMNRLYVLNTSGNIAKLEALVAALEMPQATDDGQIEIQARFVEYAEGALEELGFEWSVPEGGESLDLPGDWSIEDGQNLFTPALRGNGEVFARPGSISSETGTSTGDWTGNRLVDGFADSAGTLLITGDVGGDIDMLIRALDQTSGADVLSAPSIVTRAGLEATIQVGQTHQFPDVFEVGGSEGNIVHVDYRNFEETLTGVELSVTPRLVEDNLIEMELNPKITELLGWRGYEIAPADSAYTYFQYRIGETFEHDAIVARLPILKRREIQTSVTIADGSTIGMGGLISEQTEAFSDRVPVLGSLPLLGRFFRSEGDRTVKRNLMIFVTANKVSPDGSVISEQVTN